MCYLNNRKCLEMFVCYGKNPHRDRNADLKEVAMSFRYLCIYLGSWSNTLDQTEISEKLLTGYEISIHGAQRMNPTGPGDPLIFPVLPPVG